MDSRDINTLRLSSNTSRRFMSSSENNTKITLITLTLNSSETVNDTLNSVFEQDYSNIEHLIVDGNSTDSTLRILEEYSKKTKHEVVVLNKTPSGIYNALNYAIEKATGDVIGVLHSDDYFASSTCVGLIMKKFNSEKYCVFGNIDIINNQKSVLRSWRDSYDPCHRGFWWTPPHTATYIHKKLYDKYGVYDESYVISGDYDFFCRLPRKVIQDFEHINRTLVIQRNGGVSTQPINFFKKNFEDIRVLRKYSSTPLKDFFDKKLSKIKQLYNFS